MIQRILLVLSVAVFCCAAVKELAFDQMKRFSTQKLISITYGNGRYIAVGTDGTRYNDSIYSSVDGRVWTGKNNPYHFALEYIAYGNGHFVIIGGSYGRSVLISSDGINWEMSSISDTSRDSPRMIRYVGDRFVALGGTRNIYTSQNGKNWTTNYIRVNNPPYINDICYGGGQYVLVGYDGLLLTSTDCSTWTSVNLGDSIGILSVAYGNGRFVGVQYDDKIITSTNAVDWQRQNAIGISSINVLYKFLSGKFIGRNFEGFVVSDDGLTWYAEQSVKPTYQYDFDVASADDSNFVLVGSYLGPKIGTYRERPRIVKVADKTPQDRNNYLDTMKYTSTSTLPVRWSLLSAPLGMKIDSIKGIITWTFNRTNVGTYTIKVKLTDYGLSDTISYVLSIVNPVKIMTTQLKTAYVNSIYRDTLQKTFQPGYPLFWRILEGPSGLTIYYSDGTLHWNVIESYVGQHTVVITANDGSYADTATYVLNVTNDVSNEHYGQRIECSSFSLAANPNPFNPSVSFNVGVPQSTSGENTSVELFNISGELINRWQVTGAGYHTIRWDAHTLKRNSSSSNMFIVKARNGSNVLQQKVIYFK